MLFMQPVVVNDAHALDRATPAEVRLAEPRAAEEPPTWTGWAGTMLAQSGMDSRSPFGPNAPDTNNLTPRRHSGEPAVRDGRAAGHAECRPTPTDSPGNTGHAAGARAGTDRRGRRPAAPAQRRPRRNARRAQPRRQRAEPSHAGNDAEHSHAGRAQLGDHAGRGQHERDHGAGHSRDDRHAGTENPYRASSSTFPGMTEFTRPGGSGASNSE